MRVKTNLGYKIAGASLRQPATIRREGEAVQGPARQALMPGCRAAFRACPRCPSACSASTYYEYAFAAPSSERLGIHRNSARHRVCTKPHYLMAVRYASGRRPFQPKDAPMALAGYPRAAHWLIYTRPLRGWQIHRNSARHRVHSKLSSPKSRAISLGRPAQNQRLRVPPTSVYS